MAIYRLNVKIHGRSNRCGGAKNAVAAAAYRSGEYLTDRRGGGHYDYRSKPDVLGSFILAPQGAPSWVFERGELWNTVEKSELRKDAQLAREVVVALPRELDHDRCRALITQFVSQQFVSKGMVADVSIHNPDAADGGKNPHAHILLSLRRLSADGQGFEAKKAREWNAGFANIKNERGFLTDSSALFKLRSDWEIAVNSALEDAGSAQRVDHRSYAVQGIDQEPQKKLAFGKDLNRGRNALHKRITAHRKEVTDRNKMREYLAPRRSKARLTAYARASFAQDFDEMQRDLYQSHSHSFYGKDEKSIGGEIER